MGRKFESYLGSVKEDLSSFFAAMFYLYIIYSESADKYYIGHTSDPLRRLKEHNEDIKNSFTSHYRPRVMKRYFIVSESRSETMQIENYLKRLKCSSAIPFTWVNSWMDGFFI